MAGQGFERHVELFSPDGAATGRAIEGHLAALGFMRVPGIGPGGSTSVWRDGSGTGLCVGWLVIGCQVSLWLYTRPAGSSARIGWRGATRQVGGTDPRVASKASEIESFARYACIASNQTAPTIPQAAQPPIPSPVVPTIPQPLPATQPWQSPGIASQPSPYAPANPTQPAGPMRPATPGSPLARPPFGRPPNFGPGFGSPGIGGTGPFPPTFP